MTDDQNTYNQGSSSTTQRQRLSLKPAYKQDNPNPHSHSRGMGRSMFPTPATIAGRVWDTLGVESHTALTTAILPLFALITYLYAIGIQIQWLSVFTGTLIISYVIYYYWAPRESKHVIARLEDMYNAKRFAITSSGIAVVSVISTILIIIALIWEEFLYVQTSETSLTIATIGMAVGLMSSYLLVRVLVARALPIQSGKPLIDKIVTVGPFFEVLFVIAAIGAPLFILAAQFIWHQPEIITFNTVISRQASAMLLSGFCVLYTVLITRM